MRALIVPELYRPDNATANGTLNDAVSLVERWLDVDPTLHVYWLLPPRETADYDRSYVLADRERVTLIEAEPFMHGDEHEAAFSETGYSEAEFDAIREAIFEPGGYLDAVIDQRVTGRYDLFKWVQELGDHRTADVRPTTLIANVHDLRLPFKRHGREYADDRPTKVELGAALVADRLWFKAGVDARRMREYGADVLAEGVLDDLLGEAVETGSPIDFSAYEESYRDEPRYLHVAGSGWGKKNPDRVLDVGERLHEELGVRTLMTNMDPILPAFREREFVDAYPEADRETFERALRAGDLTVCASDHETMARTPFEQAASGQVLVIRDEPWIDDCVPDDYPLTGDMDELGDLAVDAVENWADAVAANRRLVEHVERVRSPERAGRRTHVDLRELVERRCDEYAGKPADEAVRAALARLDAPVGLSALNERTAAHTADGAPVLAADDYARTDLVCALRALDYRDTGTSGTPAFAPAAAVDDSDAGRAREAAGGD